MEPRAAYMVGKFSALSYSLPPAIDASLADPVRM